MSEPPDDLIEEAQRLIAALEAHPDPEVRAQVTTLLQHVDAIHRTALTHLVGAIHGMAGEAFMNRLTADPAIRLLLMSYDLLAVDRRLMTEEALDAVRGHLHTHGIDVELTDVVGGVVYLKLHGADGAGLDAGAVRRDLESALQAGLPGFQELVIGERQQSGASPLLQISGAKLHAPVHRAACAVADVPPGTLKAVDVDGDAILIANVAGDFHALADHCGDGPLPLRFSTLADAELRCSWHGCRYDVRTGARVDGHGESLRVYPVRIEHGEVRVVVAVAPVER